MSKELRHPFRVVVVTGVPGVGKTTVLSKAKDEAEKYGLKILVLNLGDFMSSEAIRRGLVKNRDELRYMSLRQQLELQDMAAKAMINEATKKLGDDGFLLVDTHAVIRTPYGLLPGLPQHVVDELRPDAIVLLEADPREIALRQARDVSRYRADMGGEEGVRELMEWARKSAIASAVSYASLVRVIVNKEGKAEEAAEELVELLRYLGTNALQRQA